MKYVKVMFGQTSGANKDLKYKIGSVNIDKNWNPDAENPKDMGGFNFSTEDKILRWLSRGDTIYDVEVPKDAQMIDCSNKLYPNGIYRANKIILTNPRPVTDSMAKQFYFKSNLKDKSYFKSLAGCAVRGYKNTALQILKDKVNENNVKEALEIYEEFLAYGRDKDGDEKLINEIRSYLQEINNPLLITISIDRKPYKKKITEDKIINITGESGSGKSTYVEKYKENNNYIIVDTDIVFNDNKKGNDYENKIKKIIKNKYKTNSKDLLMNNFDECYKTIINCLESENKTIIIDSAQFRNIKDYKILKGQVVVIRTSIDTCFDRCIKRYKTTRRNYSKQDLENYINKKRKMYDWYKSLNEFIKIVDNL